MDSLGGIIGRNVRVLPDSCKGSMVGINYLYDNVSYHAVFEFPKEAEYFDFKCDENFGPYIVANFDSDKPIVLWPLPHERPC
jgi:hypothetical protein